MDRDAIIAALIFGGSGSGGGLPAVTSADNGKVLGVTNGAWGAVADKGDPFYCQFTIESTLGNISALYPNKTLAQIKQAMDAGKDIIATIESVPNIGNIQARVSEATITSGQLSIVQFSIAVLDNLTPKVARIYYDSVDCMLSLIPLDMGDPYEVTLSITGQAVNNVYPIVSSKTIEQIETAIQNGKDIIAKCNLGEPNTPQARISSLTYSGVGGSLSYVSFSILGVMNGTPVFGSAELSIGGNTLTIIPLSAAQMTYDSTTQTLAIVDPLA